jgi:hypothetical protein
LIYEFPESTEPLRQGDILIGVPRIELSLLQIPVVNEQGEQVVESWDEIARREQEVAGIFAVKPVAAIIASQDCDTLRSRDITLCEIGKFREIEKKSKDTSSPKKWKDLLTQHARINQKWFYLPPDSRLGFTDKMAVDFLVTIRLPREELETLRHRRKGRLNPIADDHFRERLSEFFRRYAYDEWYALDPAELAAYQNDYPGTPPFPWQHTVNES